jgi:predicted anti-sigma-YlaC factor YlaD
MTGNDNNPIARGEHVTEMLSAYIDGTLEAAERDSVRAHLDGCAACRADHAELVATRAMLRAVPAIQAPRSFTLTPEMAREARPPSLFERIFTPSNAPRMATASVLSFLLLFFVLIGSVFRSPDTTFYKIGSGLSGDGGSYSQAVPEQVAPAPEDRDAETMAGQSQDAVTAAQATATTGAAADTLSVGPPLAPPMGTPAPSAGDLPPGAGGEVQPAVPTVGTNAGVVVLPPAVPTTAAGVTGGDTGTTASVAPTATAAEAPDEAFAQFASPEANRQAAPSNPPVDLGATVMSITPLFLLALGLALAVMAWIAGRSRPE